MSDDVTTSISSVRRDDVIVRGKSLTKELMGSLTFTQMLFFQILGRVPSDAETAVVDACLVGLMEHGLTPTVVTTRMTYTSAPEAMQGAVAAGLSSVGSLYVGTMEGCSELLVQLVEEDDLDAAAEALVTRFKEDGRRIPGFGHPQHKPDDPRAERIFDIARDVELAGRHTDAVHALSRAVDASAGKHITLNITGAIAAVLGDCGVPTEIMRGFALISRCAGLVGHIHEEQHNPVMHAMWHAAEQAVGSADGTD